MKHQQKRSGTCLCGLYQREAELSGCVRGLPVIVVIASKVYFNPGRLSAGAIHREIDGTLKRLGTDYLDLYIIHRFDYETPIEETMEALNDLVKAGKVRALGASAMYGYQFYNMQLVAKEHGCLGSSGVNTTILRVSKTVWGIGTRQYNCFFKRNPLY